MHVCPNCLYETNHAFHLSFFDQVCLGCLTHAEKNILDWEERKNRLTSILKKYKKNNKKYDCIIPVVGDAEDYFVVDTVLKFGLSPLIVSVNDYFKNEIGWKNYHTLITNFDLDSICFNPNLEEYKELIRTSFRKANHIHLPWLYLHTAYPVHVAIERNIPLIIWGQSQPVEQVGKFSHLDEVEMTKWSRREHDTLGYNLSDIIGTGAQINTRHLKYYEYPKLSTITQKKVRGIYLSNFLRWDPLYQNKSTIKLGFTPESNNSSYDVFERSGSSTYYTIHDILKKQRVGYRKINDHIARDLRHGHINKEDATNLLEAFGKRKVNIKNFFDWLGVTESGYEWLIKYRFNDVQEYITIENENIDIKLPKYLSDISSNIEKSTDNFILYGKGI